MRYLLATTAALAAAGPACAQDFEVRPLAEVRLRNEHVDQDGLPREADAVTARVRTGVEIGSGPWSATVQGQGTLALVDHYDDGLHGPADRPQISDPQNIGLYVAQLQYRTKGARRSRWMTSVSSAMRPFATMPRPMTPSAPSFHPCAA